MAESLWQFCIDVGGTFTDVVARPPEGGLRTFKLLSTGAVRGRIGAASAGDRLVDPSRIGEPADLWVGYSLTVGGSADGRPRAAVVREFDPLTGTLRLSENLLTPAPRPPAWYELRSGEEALVMVVRRLMGLALSAPIPAIDIRLGTTRATNALLERKGARTAFLTTRGFADVLKIGYQDRPELYALHIRKRDELAAGVVEIDERLAADGAVLRALDEEAVRRMLEALAGEGFVSLAVCLLHAHVNPIHEERIGGLAAGLGFAHVSLSSRVARLERIVPRGDTTMLDAYLSPVIRGYVASLRRSMPEARIMLMTSAGGLVAADGVGGKDTILSGPAGGVMACRHVAAMLATHGGTAVSAVRQKRTAETAVPPEQTAETAAAPESCPSPLRIIGFDMGGTSTDVSRIDGDLLEYQHETVKAGVRMMTPMLAVETVAAGGGSVCAFDGQRLTVGPHSAGADPGPACYGRGGPLAVR